MFQTAIANPAIWAVNVTFRPHAFEKRLAQFPRVKFTKLSIRPNENPLNKRLCECNLSFLTCLGRRFCTPTLYPQRKKLLTFN